MYCPYGVRCQFKHKELDTTTSDEKLKDNSSEKVIQAGIENAKAEEKDMTQLLNAAKVTLNADPTKKRLSIFEKITFTK